MRRGYLPLVVVTVLGGVLWGVVRWGEDAAPVAAQQTEPVELFRGCNNVSLTWPNGTSSATVVSAITPSSAVESMWRFNNVQQTFQGYAPMFPQASDLTTVNRIDAVFVCMTEPGRMDRPVLLPGGGTPVPFSGTATPLAATATATPAVAAPQISAPATVARGAMLPVQVQTSAGAQCFATLVTSVGVTVATGMATAAGNGFATINLAVPMGATAGSVTLAVICNGQPATRPVTIT